MVEIQDEDLLNGIMELSQRQVTYSQVGAGLGPEVRVKKPDQSELT